MDENVTQLVTFMVYMKVWDKERPIDELLEIAGSGRMLSNECLPMGLIEDKST